jgi:hypothetical protein
MSQRTLPPELWLQCAVYIGIKFSVLCDCVLLLLLYDRPLLLSYD